jgi:hypothetical protein
VEFKFVKLHICGAFENTKYEGIYDPKLGSEFWGVIVDVVHVDMEMQRFDGCSSDKDLETHGQIFPMSFEHLLAYIRAFVTGVEVYGADERKDMFGWCSRVFAKGVRIDTPGSPQLNFIP